MSKSAESSPPFAVAPVAPGDFVGRYELLYPAAQGGMGSVWAARLRGMSVLERLFAIKMVLPQYAAEPSFRDMFLDEARIASRIVHPNTAPVLDVGEHQGGLYLVMEWVEGDSLHVMMRAATKRGMRLPLPVILRVLADACGGLHAAHELRDKRGVRLDVVHRDVSPQNILVAKDGSTKLIDFGVAKARGRLHGETSFGLMKGKLRFMAPEQASGMLVDRRADVFAMGAVLFFLLTGHHAYDGQNEASTLHALLAGAPRRALPDNVPPVVARLVDRTLQTDPKLRFQTAAELQSHFEEAITTLRVRATTSVVQSYYGTLMQHRIAGRARALEGAIRTIEQRADGRGAAQAVVASDLGDSGARGIVDFSIDDATQLEDDDLLPAEDDALDRPTNPEPFAVRTTAAFETSYRRISDNAARRRQNIIAVALGVLCVGVVTAAVAVVRREKPAEAPVLGETVGPTNAVALPAAAPHTTPAAVEVPVAPPEPSSAPRAAASSSLVLDGASSEQESVAPRPRPQVASPALAPVADPSPTRASDVRPSAVAAKPILSKPPSPEGPVSKAPPLPAVDPLVTATESRK